MSRVFPTYTAVPMLLLDAARRTGRMFVLVLVLWRARATCEGDDDDDDDDAAATCLVRVVFAGRSGVIGAIEKIGTTCVVHLTEQSVHLSVQESGSEGVDVYAELIQVCLPVCLSVGRWDRSLPVKSPSADCVLRLFLLSWLVCQDLPSRSPLARFLHVSLVRPALASCPVPSLLLESVWPYSRSPWRRAEANGGNSDTASMTTMTTNATRSNIERRTGMSSESMPCQRTTELVRINSSRHARTCKRQGLVLNDLRLESYLSPPCISLPLQSSCVFVLDRVFRYTNTPRRCCSTSTASRAGLRTRFCSRRTRPSCCRRSTQGGRRRPARSSLPSGAVSPAFP